MTTITHTVEHDVITTTEVESPAEEQARKARRKKMFLGLAIGVALLGGAYYAYDILVASRHAVTDNAYVGANVAQVTPLIGGPVAQVLSTGTEDSAKVGI